MKNQHIDITQNEPETRNPEDVKITGMLMVMEDLFSKELDKISGSLKMHDLGHETELTKSIKESMENPHKALSRLSDSYEQTILSAKEAIITAIYKANKELINVAAYTHDENATHLFLVLRNNDEETRDIFYDYLMKIEETPVFIKFPIIFHFASEDMLSDVFELKYINDNE